MEEIIKQTFEFIKLRWHRKSSLAVLILFVLVLLIWFFSGVDISQFTISEIVIGLILIAAVAVFWMVSTRIPKAPKDTIGFALGIVAESPDQQQKIKRDFSQTLQGLLNRSKFRYKFSFVELPNYFVETISSHADATKILHDARCSFMVYGKVRTVTLNGQLQQILSLEGIVAHKSISHKVNETFSTEFADLFPRRIAISSEGDLFQFEITANVIDTVSKYIIGIAALLSGDIGYSQELFENLQNTQSIVKSTYPGIVKINQRLPSRLEDIYIVQLNIIYYEWMRTRDPGLIVRMEPYLDKLKVISPNNLDARFFRTFWYFIDKHDIKKAKAEILRAKVKKHSTWQYNYAFLLAYEGNIQEAEKNYHSAVKEVFWEPRVILDIIEFIMWVLDSEPDKTQLHYCLGIIHYYAVKDHALALQNFQRFVETTPSARFSSQIKESQKMILKIQKDIKSGKLIIEN